MELSQKSYNILKDYIDKSLKNKNYELELRFNKYKLNYSDFQKIFQKFTFSKSNNGLGYKYEMINELDIVLNTNNKNNFKSASRMIINGSDNIKKKYLGLDLDSDKYSFMEKEKISLHDDEEYGFRISLNNEIVGEKFLKKNKEILVSNDINKFYRLKNRYRILTDDELFFIDLTNVKSGSGINMSDSNVLKNISRYEIEIELNNNKKNVDSEEIIKKLLEIVYILLTIFNNNNIIIKENVKKSILDNYFKMINLRNGNKFIAASPVTIHKENLIKSDEIPNLYNKYAVTLKADGERYFLFVNDDGHIYLFNNSFNIIDSGKKNKEFRNTLIEGELIDTDTNKIFYAYDNLFSKGIDVRRKHLIMSRKGEKVDDKYLGRLDYLDRFINSDKFEDVYNNKNLVIEINKKKYQFSIREDGSDIFDKIKYIWDNRKYNNFEVDGVILVPKFAHYPLKGGSWNELFKWKPPYLNTIDFLIKYIKNEDGNIVNSPFIEDVERLDDKKEKKLRIYQTLELYVGGEDEEYNNKQKRMIRKLKPILFNPYKINNISINNSNSAKIFINSNDKLYCEDPITKLKEEILDDTIVEFGYDDTKEDGFNWIPYRFRRDKTNLYKSGENVFGNFEKVANDIFRSIKEPIDEELITTGNIDVSNVNLSNTSKSYFSHLSENKNAKRERFPYQNFHNHYIKGQLFYFTSPQYIYSYSSGMHGKLLDLCSGKGVDITKIKKVNYAEVVGIEIDGEAVKYAQGFYKKIPRPKPASYYVRGDTSKLIFPNQECGITESDKIFTRKYIPSKYKFDTVSLMFCFHYFYQNEITFRTILQNVNDNLKIDGYMIGTCFDGEKIYNLLQKDKVISGQTYSGELMWKIEKKYKSKFLFTEKKPNFGKEIDVLVKSIGYVHKEYLVNFKYVDKMMTDYGFELVLRKPFEDFYNELKEGKNLMNMSEEDLQKNIDMVNKMSEDEKRFSFLSTAFIYKKINHSSDRLFVKLAELIEKESKVKEKKAEKVDDDKEIIIQEGEK